MRKLQEEDMEKVHLRAKRLANKKKNDIMSKDVKDKNTYLEVENRKEKQIQFRYRNRVSFNIHHSQFNESMNKWAQTGFNLKKLSGAENKSLLS